MKKSKRLRHAEAATAKPPAATAPPGARTAFLWWPWVAALAGLVLVFEIYGPALNGPFVLDDLYLPFGNKQLQGLTFIQWASDPRPLLMISFWLNHYFSGDAPYAYHATNVFLHFLVAVVVALIAMRLVEWTGAAVPGRDGEKKVKKTLGIFAGALFLVHPMQVESVAYVASRSEVLSVLFYYAAYCVFLYRRTESITWPRALAVLALFAAAIGSKQHTLTLPLLLLITDLFWPQGSLRANRLLYGLMAALAVAGAVFVARPLLHADTAGLHVAGLRPFDYFLTQCRVVWTYVRLFVFPYGQNADPDVAISHGLFDGGAIFGLLAWVAVAGAAWFYRNRWPLASFGVFVYLLLLAPTSSFIPIQDVLQERRLYLPFLGLALVCLEFLRRFEWKQRLMIEAPVLLVLLALTYQRSQVWGSPLALWQDTVAKSPNKVRPRFQLAEVYYDQQKFPQAVENYEIAAKLGTPDYRLLVNYGLALDQTGRHDEALARLQQAAVLDFDPEVWTLIAQVYGEQHKVDQALQALNRAETINPAFEMTYAIRGNVYESIGALSQAMDEYQHALRIDPYNDAVREALARVQREENGRGPAPRPK
jgi:protein O-mannosyl-transferase